MGKRNDRLPTSESARIASRFRTGDPEAAAQVRQRVRRTLAFRGYGIPEEDRSDLEQVVMTQIWRTVERPDFDATAGFLGLVEIVVARRCIDWRRTRHEEVSLDSGAPAADPAAGPLATTLRRERLEMARAVVARLPAPCRELIRLHLERDMTYAEAAEVLGAAEGALRVRMHRCIRRAQEVLRQLESEKVSPPV